MNILVLYPETSEGIKQYRFISPHTTLKKLYPKKYNITFSGISSINKSEIEKADVIYTHYSVIYNNKFYQYIKSLNGKKTLIADIDDYWLSNIFSNDYYYKTLGLSRGKQASMIINATKKKTKSENKQRNELFKARINVFDKIITTTDYLANAVGEFHNNVSVIPNALDPKDRNINKKKESDKFRVLWGGGASHYDDLKLLDGMFTYCVDNIPEFQFVLCGYNNKIRTKEGLKKSKEGTLWKVFEQNVTDNFYGLSDDYRKFLWDIIEKPYKNEEQLTYLRRWTKPINRYLSMYQDADVVLAPLVRNTFSNMKSELKMIEAGMAKKAFIASDVEPYRKVINKDNGLVVGAVKSYSNKLKAKWGEAIKYMYDNPSFREDSANKLHEMVVRDYDINKITEKRNHIYGKL